MSNAVMHAKVVVNEAVLPFALSLELQVTDPELVHELIAFTEGRERDAYALCALKIGLLALKQARGQIDADVVRRESERLMLELGTALDRHKSDVHQNLESKLKEYFDPSSGRFHERIERLLQKDGDLERFLCQQIGSKDSELCKTLAAHVGENSPLMKFLGPNESAGLIHTFTNALARELTGSRETILREFSLNHEESALNRLVKKLKEEHGELSTNFHSKIDSVVKEFDLNTEESALSRLVRRVETAQKTITDEFSLNSDTSALARLKHELTKLLTDHAEAVQKFQQDVRESLESMRTWRAAAARTTLHGLDFEARVVDFVQRECQPAGDSVAAIGSVVGLKKNCKTGDCVVQIGPDHWAAGACIVIEAKEDKKFSTVAAASAELTEARENRGAEVGVFVFSRKYVQDGIIPLQRHGDDVVVVWDAEDPSTDVYLRGALLVAKALCTRRAKEREAQSIDFAGIETSILDIQKRAENYDAIKAAAEKINDQTGVILDRVRIDRKALEVQLKTLRELIGDLKGSMTGSVNV